MSNLSVSDLIFSQQENHTFSQILGDLKRSNLSVSNRLRSIRQDASFVARVAAAFDRPLVSNERCGSWYVDPAAKKASAYFKSTDGHTNQWKFSTRRLNMHLLPLIASHDGCIIVDSTRRGKRMPDALSKTVPIWCCVLNRVLFPEDRDCHELRLPPSSVSESEHNQILARIPEFVESLGKLCLNLDSPRKQLKRPLRPFWVTPETHLVPTREIFVESHPVICCTCSRRVAGTEISGGGYIQGAADDTENWAQGLTPTVFWNHVDELLSTADSDLPAVIQGLVSYPSRRTENEAPPKQVTESIYVGVSGAAEESSREEGWCRVVLTPDVTPPESWVTSTTRMEVGLGKHKAASRSLRHALPRVCSFASQFLSRGGSSEGKYLLITCETGKDISVGVALALYCFCFDLEGRFRRAQEQTERYTKDTIRMRLGKIMTAMPEASPNRATLQSVNSFLMDWRSE